LATAVASSESLYSPGATTRAGTPPEIIAAQLGHVDATMVLRVYGRFFPGGHDREKWERIAGMQDLRLVAV
jgi:hypothetical protein